MEEQLYTAKQASEYLKMHGETLKKKAKAGEIKGYKPAGKWLFELEDLIAYSTGKAPASTATALTGKSEARISADDDIAREEGAVARKKTAFHETDIKDAGELGERLNDLDRRETAVMEAQANAQEKITEAEEGKRQNATVKEKLVGILGAADKKAKIAQEIIDSRDAVEEQAMDEKSGLVNLVDAFNQHRLIVEALRKQGRRWDDEHLMDRGSFYIKKHNALVDKYNEGGNKEAIANAVILSCRSINRLLGEYGNDKMKEKTEMEYTNLVNLVGDRMDDIETLLHRCINEFAKPEPTEEEREKKLQVRIAEEVY